jgi:DNA-binding transcriptional MerR regulator
MFAKNLPHRYALGVKGSRKGRYRIQSVAEMTGVPASTLRAWEQRYGFPAPERTASSYRVYSPDDVDLIARVRALCDGGMAPAEAVAEVLDTATRSQPSIERAVPAPTAGGPLANQIIAAADTIDPAALETAIRSALLVGSREVALGEAIEPAWTTIRARWLDGTLGAGAERIAAEVFHAAARDLIRLGQPTAPTGYAVIAGFGGDDDPVAPCRLALSVQARGHRAVLLPARVSMAALADAVSVLDASLLALALTEAPPPGRTRELVDEYARIAGTRSWVVGGPAAAEIAVVVRAVGGSVAA